MLNIFHGQYSSIIQLFSPLYQSAPSEEKKDERIFSVNLRKNNPVQDHARFWWTGFNSRLQNLKAVSLCKSA